MLTQDVCKFALDSLATITVSTLPLSLLSYVAQRPRQDGQHADDDDNPQEIVCCHGLRKHSELSVCMPRAGCLARIMKGMQYQCLSSTGVVQWCWKTCGRTRTLGHLRAMSGNSYRIWTAAE